MAGGRAAEPRAGGGGRGGAPPGHRPAATRLDAPPARRGRARRGGRTRSRTSERTTDHRPRSCPDHRLRSCPVRRPNPATDPSPRPGSGPRPRSDRSCVAARPSSVGARLGAGDPGCGHAACRRARRRDRPAAAGRRSARHGSGRRSHWYGRRARPGARGRHVVVDRLQGLRRPTPMAADLGGEPRPRVRPPPVHRSERHRGRLGARCPAHGDASAACRVRWASPPSGSRRVATSTSIARRTPSRWRHRSPPQLRAWIERRQR